MSEQQKSQPINSNCRYLRRVLHSGDYRCCHEDARNNGYFVQECVTAQGSRCCISEEGECPLLAAAHAPPDRDNHYDKKFDQGKPRFDLIDPSFLLKLATSLQIYADSDTLTLPRLDLVDVDFILSIATVLAHGAVKYSANSWQNVPDAVNRYRGAQARHQNAIHRGELVDQDSGLSHSSHANTNGMFIDYLLREESHE